MSAVIIIVTVSFYLSFALSLIFNGILIFLILCRTSPQLRQFSKVLLQAVFIDVFASFAYTFVQFHAESTEGVYFVASAAPWNSHATGVYKCWWVIPHVTPYMLCNWSGPVQAVTRYYKFCRQKTISSLYVGLVYLCVFTWMVSVTASFTSKFENIQTSPKARELILKLPFWQSNEAEIDKFCAVELLTWHSYVFLGSVILLAMSAGGIIQIFNKKVTIYLSKTKKHMSVATIAVQAQFGHLLVVQSILPCLCAILGVAIVVNVVFMQHYNGGLFMFLFYPLSWIPVLNPIITVICIAEYRRRILYSLGIGRADVSSTHVVMSTLKKSSKY